MRLDPLFDEMEPTYVICLPIWARNKGTMLHELAHVFTECQGHTRLFVETYIERVASYTLRDADALVQSAGQFGIDRLFEDC
jgi:hypothetical protein